MLAKQNCSPPNVRYIPLNRANDLVSLYITPARRIEPSIINRIIVAFGKVLVLMILGYRSYAVCGDRLA